MDRGRMVELRRGRGKREARNAKRAQVCTRAIAFRGDRGRDPGELLSFSHAIVTLTRKNVKIDTSSTTSHGKDKKPRRKMNGG